MAENESLDLNISQRWFRVLKAILKGENNRAISDCIFQNLQKSWQRAQKQFNEYGTSLEQLITATLQQEDLSVLYRKTRRHDFVKLFDTEQTAFGTPEHLMERVVSGSLQRVLDQFRDRLLGTKICPNLGVWQQLQSEWVGRIGGEIERFAHRLAARPGVMIRVPAVAQIGAPATPESFLNISLLNRVHVPTGVGV